MGLNDDDRPVINIIRKKKAAHTSHGGAWKVAYADFVTAMMSLFIVLWCVGQSKQVKDYIAHYFRDPGASFQETKSSVLNGGLSPMNNTNVGTRGMPISSSAREMNSLQREGKKLEEMIAKTPEFKKFTNQISITVSKEGLRIELIENAHGLFFNVGSAQLKPETVTLLQMIAKELSAMPNQIIIEGYTDARPYVTPTYTNWELSTDRANAARKVMDDGGLLTKQILEVRGYGDRRLRDPAHPYDFSNRRVSILVTPMTSDTSATAESQVDTMKIGANPPNGFSGG
ncbi:MAG: OmpA family protein [Bacteroidetes bacterium]|jgi:chemotaxis protein MotB|nr:OmpA family protein [Bacteroidota bacterium]MCL5035390.1 OmpA family protein [Bacteroidota bacterium]